MLRAVIAAALLSGAILLVSAPAEAFCVVNESSVPIDIRAGGTPPIYVRPRLQPGDRDCHVPRKPEGILVEIYDNTSGTMRCRQSIPAKNSTIVFGNTCRVKLD